MDRAGWSKTTAPCRERLSPAGRLLTLQFGPPDVHPLDPPLPGAPDPILEVRMRVTARDFIHPEDASAQEQLRNIPMFDQFVKAFLKIFQEQFFHNYYMSQAIRLGPNQLPHVYAHLVECCGVLDVEVPEMYLQNAGEINAFAMGDTRRFVVVTSELVEALHEEELRAVIAHEVGHLICRHTFYQTMARVLFQTGAQVFGPLAIVAAPVALALAYWSRRAEFSADRAAAVVLGGSEPVVHTMVRLSGGSKRVTAQVNVEEYLRQADAFDKLAENTWDKVLQLYAVKESTHPFTCVRAREIVRWCEGEDYHRIAAALRPYSDGTRCPVCSAAVGADWKFCRACGSALIQVAIAAPQPPPATLTPET